MIKNYFKIAWRNLLGNKLYSAINIGGLAMGLAACLLIVFYVVDELSYDRYNTNADRIYRVNEDLKLGDNKVQYAVTMPPLAQTLKREFPGVENAVRIRKASISIKKGDEYLVENDAVFTDPSVFDVFTLPLLYGNKDSALTEPNTVIVSSSAAIKYFNRLDVIGKTLTLPNYGNLKITGVIKDMPKQSHFYADFLMAMVSWPDSRTNEWLRSEYNTYVLMRKGADYKKLEAQFPPLLRKYSGEEMLKAVGMSIDDFEKKGSYFRLSLMPLTEIHLHSNMTGELGVNGTVQYVYIFSAIALFILIIACVNFMNLSTARSSNRAREVGIRKVLGSARKLLIGQFLTEYVLVTLVATIIAFIAAWLLLPAFNSLSGKSLSINGTALTWLAPAMLLIVLVIGCLAGAYPAIFLSGFQPIDVLKGKLASGFKGSRLRSFLVVFQFAIAIFLIIGSLVIYNQLKYVQNRDVGYNRNQVLIIQNAWALRDKAKILKQDIKQLTGVSDVTLTGFLPTSHNRNTSTFCKDASRDPKKTIFPQAWRIDEDYIKTLDMKLVAGRNFSDQMPSDSNALVINETAARFLGFTNPLNKTLYLLDNNMPLKHYTIIGVVKDFNFNSLRENITPVVMELAKDNGNLAIKVNTSHLPALLAQIKNEWKNLAPSVHMEYSFMDADFDAAYRSEQRMGQVFVLFTTLAILIACLGLFGLSAYAAEQRNKEIGIRKVMGASVSTIVKMLSLEFITLVVIAILIASPVAWWAMNKWLQSFAYRINIQWWVFAVSGLLIIFIAFATVGFQTAKAALLKPIKSLRSE